MPNSVYSILDFEIICKDFEYTMFDDIHYVDDLHKEEELPQRNTLWQHY